MATVLNRTTKKILSSVNTPDYPAEDWIINPNLSAVDKLPPKYWKISGDDVLPMDLGEQTAADAAELAAVKEAIDTTALAQATKALAESSKTPSPAEGASLEERVRALELKIYGG